MKTFLAILLFFILVISPAQAAGNNFDQFNHSTSEGDLETAKKILENWGSDKENDPQYYICFFNYYLHKAASSGIMLQKESPGHDEKSLELTDPQTGETAGYIVDKTIYDPELANQGIGYIKTGISKFPNHYEMRFGLLWVLKELLLFDQYQIEFKDTLEYFSKHKTGSFYWNNNEEITNQEEFLLGIIQDGFNKFYEKEEVWQNKKFLHEYTDLMIAYFPENLLGYANKGSIYYSVENYNHALQYYLQALKFEERDSLVLSNIAFSYLRLNQAKLAKEYFLKIIEVNNDPYFVDLAKEQLNKLK